MIRLYCYAQRVNIFTFLVPFPTNVCNIEIPLPFPLNPAFLHAFHKLCSFNEWGPVCWVPIEIGDQ